MLICLLQIDVTIIELVQRNISCFVYICIYKYALFWGGQIHCPPSSEVILKMNVGPNCWETTKQLQLDNKTDEELPNNSYKGKQQ